MFKNCIWIFLENTSVFFSGFAPRICSEISLRGPSCSLVGNLPGSPPGNYSENPPARSLGWSSGMLYLQEIVQGVFINCFRDLFRNTSRDLSRNFSRTFTSFGNLFRSFLQNLTGIIEKNSVYKYEYLWRCFILLKEFVLELLKKIL